MNDLLDLGVDGIFTDNPRLLKKVLQTRGLIYIFIQISLRLELRLQLLLLFIQVQCLQRGKIILLSR